jgi:hypothetical protein
MHKNKHNTLFLIDKNFKSIKNVKYNKHIRGGMSGIIDN